MASWYERRVLPGVIRLACGSSLVADYRRKTIPRAHGDVLELGIGAGANLLHYDPAHVTHLVGIEPSAELRAMAAAAPRAEGLRLDLVDSTAETLPFAARSFDSVVCTFTLCSVMDVDAVLAEARRVLRPGGALLFAEHGRAPDAGVARWQRRLEPLWTPLAGGCHLSRPVRGAIERHFAIAQWAGGYAPRSPRVLGWMEWGEARV